MENDAKSIASAALARTGKAIRSDEFEDFAFYFTIPYELTTTRGKRVLRSTDDFVDTFFAMSEFLTEHDVTDMQREVTQARFFDELTIHSTHRTLMKSGQTDILPAFETTSVLKLSDGGTWRIASSEYHIDFESPLHRALLQIQPDPRDYHAEAPLAQNGSIGAFPPGE